MLSVLLILTGCTPHPGAGIWISPTDNDAHISKVSVFFEPTVKIFTSTSEQAIMQCGWWALDKKNIEMECVHLPETGVSEIYQLNVIEQDKAELVGQGKLIAALIRKKE